MNKNLYGAGLVVAGAAAAYAVHRTISKPPARCELLPLPKEFGQRLAGHGKRTAFVFGLGFTGSRFARQLVQRGWRVFGTVRSPGKREKYRAEGIEAFVFDSSLDPSETDLEAITLALAEASLIMVTAAPVKGGDPVLRCPAILSALRLSRRIEWVGYLSTVGVYGNKDGQEVDEATAVNPSSERGRRRVAAEEAWHETGLPLCIFRLPGIYGPGRGPLAKVRGGTARRVVKQGQLFSRMHVDDIVRVCLCSAAQPRPGGVYNCVDDRPAPGHEVVSYASLLLGIEPPPLIPFEEAELSAMARSFYSECRYIRNALIKREFGFELMYPTYREGYTAQLSQEAASDGTGGGSAWPLQVPGIWRFWATSAAHAPTLQVVLVDNGSLRAASTLHLRAVASRIARDPRFRGAAVHPTSARWSDRVDAADLDGHPAEIFPDCIRRLGGAGASSVIVVPFFFGPSATVTDFCPQQARLAMNEYVNLTVKMAPPLHCPCPYLDQLLPPERQCRGADDRLARAVLARVLQTVSRAGMSQPHVFLCDHGTPTMSVNDVRQAVSAQLRTLLAGQAVTVEPCSMERRTGREYDFNAPLLEDAIIAVDADKADGIVVALLFLSPGKHAGPGGDIATIIKEANISPGLAVEVTEVMGSDPLITDIILDRVDQAVGL